MNLKRIKAVLPKNKKQKLFLSEIAEKPVVMSVGSAGTGKTFLAAHTALNWFSLGLIDRIVIVRPIVATEQIGFLPGDFKEKIDPYLMPLYDAFSAVSDPRSVQEMLIRGDMEVAPLAFMRGRSFSNCFIILDEAQNTTVDQMKMFLTRFGENVKVVITGDLSQSDIKEQNGLAWATRLLENCPEVSIIRYDNKEVVRSSLVRSILGYIEKSEKCKDIPESKED